MKRINIKEGYVALVYKNEELTRILQKGNYWLFFGEQAEVCFTKNPLSTLHDLDILLKNKMLNSMLTVIDVKDDELYLMYNRGVFVQVLKGNRYAFWNEMTDYTFERIDLTKTEITQKISRSVLVRLIALGVVREYTVGIHEIGLLFIDGNYMGELKPGSHYYWKNEQTVLARNIDIRKKRLEINGQEILTQDKANLRVNLEAVYRVVDTQKAVLQTQEFDRQLYTIIQLVARSVIGELTFDDLMIQKEDLSVEMLNEVSKKAISLGIEVDVLGIKDIVLPGDMKEIMNQVLVAQKKAQANVITRREETASTRSMLNTAKLMEDNPMLFKLKEMEYIEKIAERVDNISVSGGGKVIGQLKEIFGTH